MGIFPASSQNSTSSEVIIHADSISELEMYQSMYPLSHIYPNLQMVRTSLTHSEFSQLVHNHDPKIWPASIFSVSLPEAIPQDLRNDIHFEEYSSSSIDLGSLSQAAGDSATGMLNLEPLWDMGYNGTGIIAAVIDNGIDFSHYLLSSKYEGRFDISTSESSPCNTHGTSVAALLAGGGGSSYTYKGSGFGSKLVDIPLGCRGLSVEGDLLAGFEYILANNDTIDVVNTSFDAFLPPWDLIVQQLASAGVMVVGSAGNSGPGYHTTRTGGPGNSLHGIATGSVGYDGDLSYFSSWGPVHNMIYKPDILAPGERVETAVLGNDTDELTGTSFASPLIAGGIATVISALNTENITWNVGLLKAALLQSAFDIGDHELLLGQGIADFHQMWQDINQAELGQDNVPQLVHLSPNQGPFFMIDEIPQGINFTVPITLVSSHPQDVSFTLTGDLAGIVDIHSRNSDYSQRLMLTIDTSQVSPYSILNGSIIASLGNDTSESRLVIDINSPVKGKIGIDTHHTYLSQVGANQIGGSNIGRMTQVMLEKGYHVEEIDGNMSMGKLQEYDLIWLPDPSNILTTGTQSLATEGFQEAPFNSEFRHILRDYMDLGGYVFVSTNGYYERRNGDTAGLNTTAINPFLSDYGIQMENQPVSTTTPRNIQYLGNHSSISRGVSHITYWGNILHTSDDSVPVSKDASGRVGVAYYLHPEGRGKLLVSSSNLWMNNIALSGSYPEARQNNIQFANNVIDWLLSQSYPVKLSESITNSSISGSFSLISDQEIDLASPEIYLEGNNLIQKQSIHVDSNGSTFNFSYNITSDGIYNIIVDHGGQFISWRTIRDFTPPDIIALSPGINNSISAITDISSTNFLIEDNVSGVNSSTIELLLDGNIPVSDFSYNRFTGQLIVDLSSYLQENASTENNHTLNIRVSDNFENENEVSFFFSIHQPDSPDGHVSSDTTQASTGQSYAETLSIVIRIASYVTLLLIPTLYYFKRRE